MPLKLVGVGMLGLMMSPSAQHLTASGAAQFLRIHDRGTHSDRHDQARTAWHTHGALSVETLEDMISPMDMDGIVICVGKNGDDLPIIRNIVTMIQAGAQPEQKKPFILHCSTVSTDFVHAAHQFCAQHDTPYANYPLTGGPSGARAATMLILAGGEKALFNELTPLLEAIGRPRYLGEQVSAGAAVKLMGHCMVFNGLHGLCSAAALHHECMGLPLYSTETTEFFDFLNQGAGGTRQWEVSLRAGTTENQWEQGFMIKHAVIDALYAAQLAHQRQLSLAVTLPLINTALCLGFMLHAMPDRDWATHGLVKALIAEHSTRLDQFIKDKLDLNNISATLQQAIAALPETIQHSVRLYMSHSDFVSKTT